MAAVNGLEGVVATETNISLVDGEHGQLVYRGYMASELAATKTFEEVSYLLWYGHWPSEEELIGLKQRFVSERFIPRSILDLIDGLDPGMDLMSVLRTAISAMGVDTQWPPSVDQAIRFTAALPALIAYRHSKLQGHEPVEPHRQLSHVDNYLYMLQGGNIPSTGRSRALEAYFILTAEHGLNASTFAARVVTSTQSDFASALTAAVGALKGPLHGGAPSEVLDMLNEIYDLSRAERWIRNEIESGRRIMGFGHRVYRTEDPRAIALRKVANELAGQDQWLDMARGVEDTALRLLSEYKPGRRIYTSVEYWASAVFRACQIPKALFTPTFAASRMAGWTTHVLEQAANNRLICPVSLYRIDAGEFHAKSSRTSRHSFNQAERHCGVRS